MMLKLQEAEALLLIFANKLPVALFVNCQTAGVIRMIRTAFLIGSISERNFDSLKGCAFPRFSVYDTGLSC